MPCMYFDPEVVCKEMSRKGRCKKRTYNDGTHPWCGHDKTLITLRNKLSGKKKLNWKHFK